MNWQEGLRRITIALGVIYWIGAVGIVALQYESTFSYAWNDAPWPSEEYVAPSSSPAEEAKEFEARKKAEEAGWGPVMVERQPTDDERNGYGNKVAAIESAKRLGTALLIYLVGVGVVRGLRWIGAGFIGRPDAKGRAP